MIEILMENGVAILLGLALSIIHFFSEKYGKNTEKYHSVFISLSSGLFITFIFLFLLPEAFAGLEIIGQNIYLLLLVGFVSFHLSEKYIYQHVKNKDAMLLDLAGVHAVGFFIDHFILGMTLFFAFNLVGQAGGLIVFLLLLFHTISSAISLNHIDEYFNKKMLVNLSLSLSPLFGVLFAILLHPTKELYYSFFAISIGAILYVAIRDMLPYGEKGKPAYFIVGVVISMITILLLNSFL